MHKYIFIYLTLFFLSSCLSKTDLSEVSAGPTEREALLSTRLEKYNKAVYWSSDTELSRYIEPSYQRDYFKQTAHRSETEDLVESKVKNISFYDESSKASAYIETRFFNKSTLYVNSRYEKQDWEFYRLSGGWRIKNINELTEDHFANLISE